MGEMEEFWLGRKAIIRLTLLQSTIFLAIALGYAGLMGSAGTVGLTTRRWMAAFAWGAALFVMAVPLLYLPRQLGFRNRLEEAIATKLNIPDILLLNALVSFSEELFFRGFLLRLVGVIPSAVIFGAMHYLGYESWVEVLYALFIGLILGYLYKSFLPNILLPVSFHFLTNAFSFLLTRKSLVGATKGFETNGQAKI